MYLKVKICTRLGLDVVSVFWVHEAGCLSFIFEGELLKGFLRLLHIKGPGMSEKQRSKFYHKISSSAFVSRTYNILDVVIKFYIVPELNDQRTSGPVSLT